MTRWCKPRLQGRCRFARSGSQRLFPAAAYLSDAGVAKSVKRRTRPVLEAAKPRYSSTSRQSEMVRVLVEKTAPILWSVRESPA